MSYQQLLNHPLLSRGEERALIKAAQDGDDLARERLILSNIRLVWSIADVYAKRSDVVETEDLIADGCIGLMQAIEKFDLDKPFRASTYFVWWIRQAIARSHFFDTHVRLPEHIREDIRKVVQSKADFMREFGVEPTTQHISDAAGLPEERVLALEEIRASAHTVQSLYAPIGGDDDDDRRLLDLIPDEDRLEIREMEIAEELEWFLSRLNDLERRVVELRHGITPPRYGERMPWRDIETELYRDARPQNRQTQRVHRNDLPELYRLTMDKLRRLGRAVKAGKPMDNTEERHVMTGIGETVELF